MTAIERAWRRIRYGRPIVVVSGLPRSGTSMTMKMLEAGGMPVVTDGIREADVSNPKGYYELETVKGLDKRGDTAWLRDARGRAVKIISFLLTWLPETYDYRVLLMERDLDEVLASQNAMLVERREAAGTREEDRRLRQAYEQHLAKVRRLLRNRKCFSVLTVEYGRVLARPGDEARRMSAFLGGGLDVERMTEVADPALYRNRSRARVSGSP